MSEFVMACYYLTTTGIPIAVMLAIVLHLPRDRR